MWGSITWSSLTGTILDTTASYTVTPAIPTYYVATIDAGQCSITDTVLVNVNGVTVDVQALSLSPATGPLQGSVPFTFTVKNNSTVALSGISVALLVNGATYTTGTIAGPIAPNGTASITFATSFSATTQGQYTICGVVFRPWRCHPRQRHQLRHLPIQPRSGPVHRQLPHPGEHQLQQPHTHYGDGGQPRQHFCQWFPRPPLCEWHPAGRRHGHGQPCPRRHRPAHLQCVCGRPRQACPPPCALPW